MKKLRIWIILLVTILVMAIPGYSGHTAAGDRAQENQSTTSVTPSSMMGSVLHHIILTLLQLNK